MFEASIVKTVARSCGYIVICASCGVSLTFHCGRCEKPLNCFCALGQIMYLIWFRNASGSLSRGGKLLLRSGNLDYPYPASIRACNPGGK